AFDYPVEFLRQRVWHIARPLPDRAALQRAVEVIRGARRPLIIAGGGVIYSEATGALEALVDATGIPVAETQAGKGALSFDHPSSLGAMGVTGTPGANLTAREADVVIGVGTRYSDFTTASRTAFQRADVRFVNLNVAELDALKHSGIALLGDARVTLEALADALRGWSVPPEYRAAAETHNRTWDREVERIYSLGHGPLLSQGEIVGAVNRAAAPRDVVVCAAGSLPGDLHKLWRARDPKGYHVEYGYSCMGYEVAGGLGVKLAAPDREVYVMVGDGSWLMMSSDLVTAIQERCKLTVVLIDNHGFASIGGLSGAVGSEGFGTEYRYRTSEGRLAGEYLPVDLAANAQSLGACVLKARNAAELHAALRTARDMDWTVVIHVEADREVRVGTYDSWWDVPVAEVSEMDAVRAAREEYERARARERWYL
ncbi:MAG: thiamine pyrophosphate-dependent enzyme, partial [Gemmatimonadales bacterium]